MALYIRLKHEVTPPVGTVETIEIEKYLEGVVNAEMGASREAEALKAQAVAARTFAISKINKNNSYDLLDTTKHQAYKTKDMSDAVKSAVAATRGEVLTYQNKIITASYSSSNGGRIRSAAEVWGGNYPYLISKSDPYTQRSGYKKNGHGVGMSQRGAIQASKEGVSYSDILAFYYPGTALRSNYNGATSEDVNPNTQPKTSQVVNKGNLIVEEAMRHIGKPYVRNTSGPDNFDCSGFVWYVYKQAINYDWDRGTVRDMEKSGRAVTGDLKAGDLIFFKGTTSDGPEFLSHIGIAIGDGDKFIHAPKVGDVVKISSLSESYYKAHYSSAKRLIADVETSSTTSTPAGVDVSDSPTTADDVIAGIISRSEATLNASLSAMTSIESRNSSEASGISYGYLMDLTNGGEFQFIVPEYDKSTQATWDTVSVLSRSSDIKGYNSTQSTSINISLELIAGAGLYVSDGDRVDAMHKDIAFVESLEYPDYSKAIVFPPPIVLLYLNPTTKLRGIVQGVSVQYKRPYDTQNRPMMATLSFTVTGLTDNPPDYSDIRNRNSNSY